MRSERRSSFLRARAAIVALALLVVLAPAITVSAQQTPTEQRDPVPTTPLLSARRFPDQLAATTADPKLASSLEAWAKGVTGNECAIVTVDGRTVWSKNDTTVLAPASVMKLATAMAALDVLGADRTLPTTLVAAKAPKDGVIEGDLYLVGGGDPLFLTSGYRPSLDDTDQVGVDFQVVADALRNAGVRKVTGSIIGDDSLLSTERWIPTWPTRYQSGGTVGPISALMVNDGQTGYADSPTQQNPNRTAGDPPLLAAQTLRTLLTTRGVEVLGGAAVGTAPQNAKPIASVDSLPVSQIVGEMILDSDNTTAEVLLRLIGLESAGQGTTAAGATAVIESLRRQGFSTDGLVMLDGSGLDTGDRMPCALALALVQAYAADAQLAATLPIAGRTGTLRKRMKGTASTGRVRAKTGTLNTVNALAGFADTNSGAQLRFSMIHNGADSRGSGVGDQFADRLVTWGDGISIAALSPGPIA